MRVIGHGSDSNGTNSRIESPLNSVSLSFIYTVVCVRPMKVVQDLKEVDSMDPFTWEGIVDRMSLTPSVEIPTRTPRYRYRKKDLWYQNGSPPKEVYS